MKSSGNIRVIHYRHQSQYLLPLDVLAPCVTFSATFFESLHFGAVYVPNFLDRRFIGNIAFTGFSQDNEIIDIGEPAVVAPATTVAANGVRWAPRGQNPQITLNGPTLNNDGTTLTITGHCGNPPPQNALCFFVTGPITWPTGPPTIVMELDENGNFTGTITREGGLDTGNYCFHVGLCVTGGGIEQQGSQLSCLWVQAVANE